MKKAFDLLMENKKLIIRVFDDGLGNKSEAAEMNRGSGNGLRNMQKRMNEINGNLDIQFSDEGARLFIELPLKDH